MMNIFKPLQSLSYWHGYQMERYPHLELREIAIAHELAALMLGNQVGKLRVELEKKYKDLPLKGNHSNGVSTKTKDSLLDLFVKVTDSKGDSHNYCIEIKRLSSSIGKIEGDIDKLSSLKRSSGLSAWVIVCGHGRLPSSKSGQLWSKKGKFEIAKGLSEPIQTKLGTTYYVRRILKASSARAKNDVSHTSNYVVLLEVRL